MVKLVSILVCAVAIVGCEAEPLTEIVVVADTDLLVPGEIDALRISVSDSHGKIQEAMADLTSGSSRPVTLGLVSRDGLGTLDVHVIGEKAGAEMMRRTARVIFMRGRTLALRIDLWRRCAHERCGAGQTCGDRGCRPVDVDSAELSDWTGTPPSASSSDAALGRMDGGAPTADDGSLRDAAPTDGSNRFDARMDSTVGIDARVLECVTTADCADEWTCTEEVCDNGRCVYTARDSACDDGIACTSERCDRFAGCIYETHHDRCDDGVSCTADTCVQLSGCRHAPAHDTCDAGSYCDTTAGCRVAPSFTEIYTSIVQPRCGPCHLTAPMRGGMLDLSTQEIAYSSLIDVTAVCGMGANTRVLPGDSTRSLLWRKVAGVDLCGSRMPRGMVAPLDDAQITMIAQWIQGGAVE